MRVLVTGSNGLLGSKLLGALAAAPGLSPLATAREPCALATELGIPFQALDVTDGAAVQRVLRQEGPDVVIHAAAMTDVDGCERQPERAWSVNVEGTRHVVSACDEIGAAVVHLSTEYVFDGRQGPYAEEDPPNPISVYGRGKLASEEIVAACRKRWIVARTTILFGLAPSARRNFVLWLLERLAAGESVRVVADQIGTPTLADNLAEMLVALAGGDAHGIYHTVGASRLSRLDFAREAAEVFGYDPALVHPISTAELGQPAPRPLDAGLTTRRFEVQFPSVRVLGSRDALHQLKRQLAAAGALPARPG